MVLLKSDLGGFHPFKILGMLLLHVFFLLEVVLSLSINFILSSLSLPSPLSHEVLSGSQMVFPLVQQVLSAIHLSSPVIHHVASMVVSRLLSVPLVD